MKKVLIAGATGMVGNEVLKECLSSDQVDGVVILVRRKTGQQHSKLTEAIVEDFLELSGQQEYFKGIDAAFFCIGAYTGQVSDELFKTITVDYPIAFAEALKHNSPEASLCLLSGAGADRTEKSRMAFARYKGMAENRLFDMGLKSFYSFRPGYIYPVEKRKEPNLMYSIARFLYPLMSLFGGGSSIKSSELALAMVKLGIEGAGSGVLENREIRKLV